MEELEEEEEEEDDDEDEVEEECTVEVEDVVVAAVGTFDSNTCESADGSKSIGASKL